jgi:hypothetical protein
MALSLTINGVIRTNKFYLPGTSADVQASLMAGAIGSLRLRVYDVLGAAGYRPAIDDTIVLADGATTVFAGRIDDVAEDGLTDLDTGVTTMITASDWHAYCEQVTYTVTYSAGLWTLKGILQDLIAAKLGAFGVTLDASQAVGTTFLTALTYDKATIAKILNDLQQLTGWVWRIQPNKALIMISPASISCGYSLADGSSNTGVLGKVFWKQARASNYINAAIVKIGPQQAIEKTDSFTGNGATLGYVLTYTPVPSADGGFIVSRGYVSEGGANYPLGLFGVDPTLWTYDPATNRIVRSANLGLGVIATFAYQVQFPVTVTYTDAAEVAAHGTYEGQFDAPDVTDKAPGLTLATALVRRGIATPKTVTVRTNKGIAYPGQSIALTFAERNISGTFLITAVDVASAVDGTLEYTLTCLSGTELGESWIDFYSNATGGGVASASSGSSTVSGAFIPALTGQFASALASWAGTAGGVIDGLARFQSSLDQWLNGSLQGPALVLGRGAIDLWAWAIVADTFGGSTPGTASRLRFVPTKDSATYRFAMQLAQADVPTAGVYYLTPNQVSTLYLGGDPALFGPFFKIAGLFCSGPLTGSTLNLSSSIFERGRAAALGEWTAVAWASGDFTASGTMTFTVDSGDQVSRRYAMDGLRMEYVFRIETASIGISSGAELRIALPSGYTVGGSASSTYLGPLLYSTDNGTTFDVGLVEAVAGDTFVRLFRRDVSNWPLNTNLTLLRGQIRLETTS